MTPFDALAGHLLPGESIRWCGQPRRGFVLRWSDIIFVPFSLVWGGFMIFWESFVLANAKSMGLVALVFGLFGLPLAALGLYFICGRFFADAWRRARTVYGLTDRRVLIVRRPPWPSVRVVNLDRLADVSLSRGFKGRGTIGFHTRALVDIGEGGRRYSSRQRLPPDWTPEFFAIEHAQNVFTAIQQRRQGR